MQAHEPLQNPGIRGVVLPGFAGNPALATKIAAVTRQSETTSPAHSRDQSPQKPETHNFSQAIKKQ